jgi:type IV secretion system protein VirB10
VIILYGSYKRTKNQQVTQAAAQDTNRSSALSTTKNLKKELRDTSAAATASGKNPTSSSKQELTPPPLEGTPDLSKTPGSPVGLGGSNLSPSSSNSYHEPTAEEKRRQHAYQIEQEAFNAPTAVQVSARGMGAATGASLPNTPQLPDLLSALVGRPAQSPKSVQDALANALRGPGGDGSTQDQNQKETFLEKARARSEETYLKSTRISQLTLYEIKAGWDIPAVLEQAMNSDLPGEVRAMVRSDVYDTATGKYLLIPQGARLIGYYNSNISYGQDGIQIVWSRLIFPDGSSITLDGMNGQDETGASGFRHDVDHQNTRLFGTALLTSMFSAGLGLAQNTGQQSTLATPTPGQVAGQAIAQQVTQMGIDITRKNLSVAPTIKIPMGYRFNVRVNRDILLDRPYVRGSPQIYHKSQELISSESH